MLRSCWKLAITGVLSACALAPQAQTASDTPLGHWTGESLCMVQPSACHDESVVYDISSSAQKKGVLVWKADKIVNGEQQNMGTLECTYASSTHVVTCDMPDKGTWKLQVSGDEMKGTLTLTDGTLFRKVDVKRGR